MTLRQYTAILMIKDINMSLNNNNKIFTLPEGDKIIISYKKEVK